MPVGGSVPPPGGRPGLLAQPGPDVPAQADPGLRFVRLSRSRL